MTTIAVIGYAGGHIVDEALRRGHTVLAVGRTTPAAARPGLTARTGSLADAVPALPAIAAAHGVRLGVVGGVGSMPGERLGRYRVGGDVLLTGADGRSAISGADYAIAFVDEIEKWEHHRERFSVAY